MSLGCSDEEKNFGFQQISKVKRTKCDDHGGLSVMGLHMNGTTAVDSAVAVAQTL